MRTVAEQIAKTLAAAAIKRIHPDYQTGPSESPRTRQMLLRRFEA
jgi:hypothetical protein